MQALPTDPVSIPRKESTQSSSSSPSPRTTSSLPGSPHSTPREERTDSLFSSQQTSPSSRRSSLSKTTPPQSPSNGSLADYEKRRSSTLGSMLDKLRISSGSSSSTAVVSRASVQMAATSSSPELIKKRQGSMRGIPKELEHLKHEMVSPTFELLKKEGFKLLSVDAIEAMPPQERTLLQKKLQDEMASSPAASERINPCLQLIVSVQENLRNKRLLSLIINKATLGEVVIDAKEEVKSDSIWEPLLLASECIIAPDMLFRLIHKEMVTPSKSSSARDPVVWLQLFCEHWLKANIGTSSVRKAESSFRAIIEFAKTGLANTSQNRGARIQAALDIALTPLPARKPLALVQDKECRHFPTLAEDIIQGKFKSAKIVAEDLRQYQIMLYCQMTQSLLINAKWNVPPDEFKYMISLSNNLASYIVDRITSAPSQEASVFYIRYFLEVARYAMEFRDFATAHSIVSALSNGFVTQLRVWPLVFKASGYEELYKKLEGNLFCPNDNHKPLRQEMEKMLKEKQYLYLPSWPLLTKDMTFINENRPFDTGTDKDPDYNYNKLLMIYTSLRPFFAPQDKWIGAQRGHSPYKFQTDLVNTCLRYREFSERDRLEMVAKLSPNRNSSTGTVKP